MSEESTAEAPRGAAATAPRTGLRRVLDYQEDLAPVSLIWIVSLIQIALFFSPWPHWVVAICVLLLMPVQQLSRAILHYHYHRNMFRVWWLNRVFEVQNFLCSGLSPYQFTLHHVLGHHNEYFDPVTEPLRWKRPDGKIMGNLEFLVKGTINLYAVPVRIGPRYPRIYRRFKAGLVFCLALLALLTALNPARALIVYLGPMFIILVDIIRLNWWHHVGLESDDHLTASRNDVTRFYNWVTFNSGYHTAHHVKPTLHWSRLPALHAELADRIPAEMNQAEKSAPPFIRRPLWG